MRYAALILVVALAGLAAVVPDPDVPVPGPAPGNEAPALAVCTVQEGSGRSTTIAVLSTANGPVDLALFTGGETAGTLRTSTGASGSTLIPVGDVAAVGTVGSLLELPNPTSTAGVLVSGASSFSTEACPAAPSAETFLTGGSTVAGENFSMQFMNPFAGEAIVSLRVVSEAGVESNERFDSLVVPPRSSRSVDFNELLPGRERISVSVATELGRVLAMGQQDVEGESAVWNAVPASEDWFLPIPTGQPSRTLLIGTPSAIAVDYQVDFYGSEGLEEALVTGALAGGGQVELDLDEISLETSAVRVVSNGPVVPVLRIDSPEGLAVTAGSPVDANRWMLPGASTRAGGLGSLVILNSSIEDATVSIRPLREQSSIRELPIPSDGVLELTLETADGYLIESTSPIVAMWIARTGSATGAAMGVPIDDG